MLLQALTLWYGEDHDDIMEIFCNTELCAFYKDRLAICERAASLHFDTAGRLHNVDGPAIAFSNGAEYYVVCGSTFPSRIVVERNALGIDDVFSATITKVEAYIELFGRERFVMTAGRLDHQDPFGKLWRVRGNQFKSFVFDLVFVEVENATIENGERRKFFLRVPPFMQTAREAVAWTFNKTPKDYILSAEA